MNEVLLRKNGTSQKEVLIFKTIDGKISVDVQVDKESVWLSLNQLSELFERDKSVISRHISKVYQEGELEFDQTVAKYATVQKEGKKRVTREIEYYNLDLIISVGYRVNSKRGTQFRQWANQVLKDYLTKGYVINQRKLALEGIEDIKKSISLLSRSLQKEHINDIGAAAVALIIEYSRTWQLLLQYDEGNLSIPKKKTRNTQPIDIEEAKSAIKNLKAKLLSIGEATKFFSIDKENNLNSILNNIEQTFGGKALYPTPEIKAAHLLYFIIKDHPFIDGNKRIGSLLFLLYLKLNNIELAKINDVTLTALALLVAESNPTEKDIVIKLITNLITN